MNRAVLCIIATIAAAWWLFGLCAAMIVSVLWSVAYVVALLWLLVSDGWGFWRSLPHTPEPPPAPRYGPHNPYL